MRQVATLASTHRRRDLPASLVQRLELMQLYALAAKAQAGGRQAPPLPSRRSQAIILAWFSLGVLVSGALGAGAIVGIRAAAAGRLPLPSWTAWAKTPQPSTASRQDGEWNTIE